MELNSNRLLLVWLRTTKMQDTFQISLDCMSFAVTFLPPRFFSIFHCCGFSLQVICVLTLLPVLWDFTALDLFLPLTWWNEMGPSASLFTLRIINDLTNDFPSTYDQLLPGVLFRCQYPEWRFNSAASYFEWYQWNWVFNQPIKLCCCLKKRRK